MKRGIVALCFAWSASGDDGASLDPAKATPFLAEYAEHVAASYARATELASVLAAKVDAFVAKPDPATLDAARAAWLAAREVYDTTEAFRFYGGPIDSGDDGVEIYVNAWPVDEAYIDAVRGHPDGGLILDADHFPLLDETVLRAANEREGQANVCLGWHAIEFMLWGQDFDPAGPGRRSPDDFRAGGAKGAARRCEYLKVVCGALVHDLAKVRDAWAPDRDDYRRRFLALAPPAALRDVLRGMVVLSSRELGGERLAVAYETQDQEHEQSCFSDNTHRDLIQNEHGILTLWRGDGPQMHAGGLRAIAAAVDPVLAKDVDRCTTAALAALEAIPPPFDQAILGDDGTPGRRAILKAIEAIEAQSDALAAFALRLGFVIPLNPGG